MKKLVLSVSALLLDESIPQAFPQKLAVKKLICVKMLLWSKTGLLEQNCRSVFLLRVTAYLFEANQIHRENL